MKQYLKKFLTFFLTAAVIIGMAPLLPAASAAGKPSASVQSGNTAVCLTKLAEGFKVNISGWYSNYKYQIWSYQKITSDYLLDGKTDVNCNQWVLSQPYTLGSSGEAQPDGSIDFIIGNFISPAGNYTVSVRIIDSSNKYVGEVLDSYTPAEVQEVKITKVLVDGSFSKGIEIKEIKTGSSVLIKTIGNNVSGTYFSALVKETGTAITASNTGEFNWDTSGLAPGDYTVTLKASNGTTADTRQISFKLYSLDTGIKYGEISAMNITAGSGTSLPKSLALNPSFSNGKFYYSIGEPGRAAAFTSGLFASGDTIGYSITKYGVYQIAGFINRENENLIGSNYDDGYVKTITVSRSLTETSTASLSANVNLKNPVLKHTAIHFTAGASIGGIGSTPVRYSFWRYDANGYALVKDWSADNTLNWTPARVGIYSIEVRVKGSDAGSYEASKSVQVTVTDPAEQFAQGVVITVNETDLNANATARVPVIISASATSTNSEDLLYKFNIADAAMGTRTVQDYSADQTCIWTPRKAGDYTVLVLVKNKSSFGAYDAIKSISVTVKEPVAPNAFDYLLFSGSTTSTLEMRTNFHIYGSVHTNNNFSASYNAGTISGNCEAVGTVYLNAGTTVGKTVPNAGFIAMPDFSGAVSQVVPTTFDHTYTPSQIASMSASGRITFTGNTKITGSATISKGMVNNGKLYVQGNLSVYGSGIPGTDGTVCCLMADTGVIYCTGSLYLAKNFQGAGCLFAGGTITLDGGNNKFTSMKPACLYSANGDIRFDCGSTAVYGLVYAPNGDVTIAGGGTTFYGNIIGNTVSVIPAAMYPNELTLPFTLE